MLVLANPATIDTCIITPTELKIKYFTYCLNTISYFILLS